MEHVSGSVRAMFESVADEEGEGAAMKKRQSTESEISKRAGKLGLVLSGLCVLVLVVKNMRKR